MPASWPSTAPRWRRTPPISPTGPRSSSSRRSWPRPSAPTPRRTSASARAGAERPAAEEARRSGERGGDELPEEWAARGGRRERIREALRQIEDQAPRDYESKMEARARKEAEGAGQRG